MTNLCPIKSFDLILIQIMENIYAHGVTTQIILGKPNEGCEGHGICRILTQSVMGSFKCPSVSTIITLGADGKLQFCFLKSAMTTQVKDKHFSGKWFRMEEPFLLPSRIKSRFQYNHDRIPEGKFRIFETPQFFIVRF